MMKRFRGSLTKRYVAAGFIDNVLHPLLYDTDMETRVNNRNYILGYQYSEMTQQKVEAWLHC